ncbi:hypothetical protein [Formosa haliotis]|uniref:hypothetical protein n=1 Tax=Formosa haliotis TaxID=1555194 RepID=UPI000826839C|nr:hypothetical protein [Formosa haliotis]
MASKLDQIKAHLEYKHMRLEKVNTVLKTEFFGIDKAIDQVCANIRPWYILADFQERPMVVNIWGLTGVGKTSLIKRIMELLDMRDSVYHFDMGNSDKNSHSNILNIQKIFKVEDMQQPSIALILDEFQLARTLDNNLCETDDEKTRIIWELLDTGCIAPSEVDHKSSKGLDFSKSIVFIIGNLDDAYHMVNNFSSDVSADIYYAMSLKITLPEIKSALFKLFRKEQVSRLGNTHIIFPALSKQAYKEIIATELSKLKDTLVLYSGIQFIMDATLEELIYNEGVFPSQGARPVFTTVNTLVKSHIPNIIYEVLQQKKSITSIELKVKNSKINVFYHSSKSVVVIKQITLYLPMENLRKNTYDDLQAIVAVHESGHAILSAILLKHVPEQVHSKCTENCFGFVLALPPCNFHYRKDIINYVAMYLGGLAAEELIFGKEYVTSGSSSDINKATVFLTNMYKISGLGEYTLRYDSDFSKSPFYHDFAFVEQEMKQMMEKALALAKKTLQSEMKLLVVLSEYLCHHPQIEKAQLKALIAKHKVTKDDLISDFSNLYYRNKLQAKVKQYELGGEVTRSVTTLKRITT